MPAPGTFPDRPLTAEPVVTGVYRIAGKRSNVYLLTGNRLTLVDTGMHGDGEAVLRAIDGLGRRIEDLDHILITHAHIDHTGSLAMLQRGSGATIVAAQAETDYIEGTKKTAGMPRQGPGGALFRVMLYILETFVYPLQPASVDLPCTGGETLAQAGGVQVLATPGHSPGSLSFHLPGPRVVFSGDALTGLGGGALPPRMGCADYELACASAGRIAALDPAVVCCGHGPPIRTSGQGTLATLLSGGPPGRHHTA